LGFIGELSRVRNASLLVARNALIGSSIAALRAGRNPPSSDIANNIAAEVAKVPKSDGFNP